MTVELAISIAAIFLAAVSFWISYCEVRRNNKAIVSVVGCKAILNGNLQSNTVILSVTIHNKGIALENIAMSMDYQGSDDFGRCSHTFGEKLNSDFRRGMKAEFKIKVPVPIADDALIKFLDIKNVCKQNVCFTVTSNDFEVAQFKVGNWLDRIKSWINRKTIQLEHRKYTKLNTAKNAGPMAALTEKLCEVAKFKCVLQPEVDKFFSMISRHEDFKIFGPPRGNSHE